MNWTLWILSLFSFFFPNEMSLQEFEVYQKSKTNIEISITNNSGTINDISNENIQLQQKTNGIILQYLPLWSINDVKEIEENTNSWNIVSSWIINPSLKDYVDDKKDIDTNSITKGSFEVWENSQMANNLINKANSSENNDLKNNDLEDVKYLTIIWTWSDLWWMVFKMTIPSTQFSIDNIHNYFEGMWENEREKILTYWNFNTEKILKYVNDKTCSTYKEKVNESFNNKEIPEINIVLQGDEFNLVLWCEIYFNHYNESEIVAPWEKYREFNITQWLNTLNNDIWEVWKDYSIMSNVNTKSDYMNWYALILKNGKVTHQLVEWGSLCGISTIFYQNSLKTNNLEMVELHNHMNYYSMYYWKQNWLDSTIYSANWTVYKDLKVKNNTNWNIIIRTRTISEDWKFKYYVKFFSPFIPDRIIEGDNKTYKKNWKRCVSFTYWEGDSKTSKESCYYSIE